MKELDDEELDETRETSSENMYNNLHLTRTTTLRLTSYLTTHLMSLWKAVNNRMYDAFLA